MLVRVVAVLVSAGMCAVVGLVGGCGTESAPEEEPVTTVTVEKTPDAAEPTATAQQPPAADRWAMPDLVGETLQDAQDRIQDLTDGAVLITLSHDLTGQDRNQVLDQNWQVCTQNIAPGGSLTTESEVDFGVVKIEEPCP